MLRLHLPHQRLRLEKCAELLEIDAAAVVGIEGSEGVLQGRKRRKYMFSHMPIHVVVYNTQKQRYTLHSMRIRSFILIYIYIHVNIYIYMYVCIYIYIYTYIYIHIHIYIHN